MTSKENQCALNKSYELETLKWHMGASLVIDFIYTQIPTIIKIDSIFPSIIYLKVIQNLLRKKVAKPSLESYRCYRVEVINTSRGATAALTRFKFKSIQKIASNILEKNR